MREKYELERAQRKIIQSLFFGTIGLPIVWAFTYSVAPLVPIIITAFWAGVLCVSIPALVVIHKLGEGE